MEGLEVWNCATLGACQFDNPKGSAVFVDDGDLIVRSSALKTEHNALLERAGMRSKVFFDAKHNRDLTAGIVSCGGLCPGLNSVIRSLVLTLHYSYGVTKIKGFRYGYEGLGETSSFMMLTPETVAQIHHFGGTLIGTSRGPQKVSTMVDCLVRENISMLFTIGGDGTLRGAKAICDEIASRHLAISVVGVPKTIDNDIPVMERTFGFHTAVSRAVEAINSAHCEAFSHRRGLALVKLMGRDSGFIALNATMASGEVNLCLIPECPFDVDEVVHYLEKRLQERNHCVVVVAEGAGQDCFAANAPGEHDKSGNTKFVDVGLELKKIFEKRLPDLTLKYIDPSYIIRSAPAEPHDEEFCVLLSQMAVHAAMAGKTCMTIAFVSGEFCHLPLSKLEGRKHVDTKGSLFQAMLNNVGQPACMKCISK